MLCKQYLCCFYAIIHNHSNWKVHSNNNRNMLYLQWSQHSFMKSTKMLLSRGKESPIPESFFRESLIAYILWSAKAPPFSYTAFHAKFIFHQEFLSKLCELHWTEYILNSEKCAKDKKLCPPFNSHPHKALETRFLLNIRNVDTHKW